MPDLAIGQEIIWVGSADRFAHRATILRVRQSYLAVFGETPADAKTVYDIADLVTRISPLGVSPDQVFAHDHGWAEDMDEARGLCPACLAGSGDIEMARLSRDIENGRDRHA